jgi:preprotein translocase subunit SecY
MFIPAALAGLSKSDTSQSIALVRFSLFVLELHNCFITLYIGSTNKMSDDLKKRWFYSIRPGVETQIILIK